MTLSNMRELGSFVVLSRTSFAGFPFSHLERISVIGRHVSSVSSLIARARSMSSLSRERIGERVDDLERDLKTLLARAASDGMLTEIIE